MRVISLILSLVFLYSCEDSRTACLDFYASNYDFGAVEPCDSCCVYPTFEIDFDFNYDTLSYHKDSLYVLAGGDTLQIRAFNLVLSNFLFLDASDEYRIIDTVIFNGEVILDDYLLVRSNRSGSIVVGHTNYEADFNAVNVNIGFDPGINNDDAIMRFVTSSQLRLALDSMYNEELMTLNKFETDIVLAGDSINLSLDNKIPDNLIYNIVETLEPGIDWNIKLTVDLGVIFAGFEKTLTKSELEALIEQNLSAGLFLE